MGGRCLKTGLFRGLDQGSLSLKVVGHGVLRAEERGSGAVGLGLPGLLPLSLPHPHPLPRDSGAEWGPQCEDYRPNPTPFLQGRGQLRPRGGRTCPGLLAAGRTFPYVLAPLSFMFQGLPGPVGDPGPKGSRVSGSWQVPHRWGPGWSLPVPPDGRSEVQGLYTASGRGAGASALPPECSPESQGAAGWTGDGGSLSQVSRLGARGAAATVRRLPALSPSTSQELGDLSQGYFVCC